MKHQPERTCVGCRRVFNKNNVVRVVAGPEGPLIDYREKLPGRAAYVCPRYDCIKKGISGNNLAKALRMNVKMPTADLFASRLAEIMRERIMSLLSVCLKAGKIAAGHSAVDDALQKGHVRLLLFAGDLSAGTRDKIGAHDAASVSRETDFTRAEFGRIFCRDLVGVVAILEEGLAGAVDHELRRLKGLLNSSN